MIDPRTPTMRVTWPARIPPRAMLELTWCERFGIHGDYALHFLTTSGEQVDMRLNQRMVQAITMLINGETEG